MADDVERAPDGIVAPLADALAPTLRDPRRSRLDPWVDAYAARTRGMTASEIRALFAVASRPEVVSLAGGMPYLSRAAAGRRRPRPCRG